MVFKNLWVSLDLQKRVILILFIVIFPVSLILSAVTSRLFIPAFYDELKQLGLAQAQVLQNQIETRKLWARTNPRESVEDVFQRLMYAQPTILRLDLIRLNEKKIPYIFASSLENPETEELPRPGLVTQVEVFQREEDDVPVWQILMPVKWSGELMNLQVMVSLKIVRTLRGGITRVNIFGALASAVLLVLLLNFFLRRAIQNEQDLKRAQASNELLQSQLLELQREWIQIEKLAAMGQLTAQFAHEIGTPLNAMSGHLQLMRHQLPEFLDQRAKIIEGQIQKIEKIVKNFLASTSRSAAEREWVSVHETMDRVIEVLSPTLHRYEIRIEKHYARQDDQIRIAPVELEQVLFNILNNAIDALKGALDSFRVIQIETRTVMDQGVPMFKIVIQDNGPGLYEGIKGKLFHPFVTTKPVGEGNGLGLSICQQILKSHQGNISVSSLTDSVDHARGLGNSLSGVRVEIDLAKNPS